MPIQITCHGCHSRFKVSEKFAGKTGPCPKCKTQIRIPTKSEDVVIHTPEEFGPKNTEGQAVLKPIKRTETNVTPVGIVAVCGSVVLVLAVAFLLGRTFDTDEGAQVPVFVLSLGALVLAPPVALGAYSFLRYDELEPYRGTSLAVRVLLCGAVYAMLWGVYAYLRAALLGDGSPEIWQMVFAIPALVAAGALAPLASLDLDYTSACFHYGLYLLVTVLLRLVMGMPPF